MEKLTARLTEHRATHDELFARRIKALKRLAEIAQGNTHQPQHCRRILLAVYNGSEWPLDLTRLRVLDRDLQRAAFTVIAWSADCDRELYEYLENGSRLMQHFCEMEKSQ